MNSKNQKTLALALGGGSALGFAHIGFLQILEENNIKVNAIAGTSMGSVIGGFYAFGYSAKEIEVLSLEKIHARQFWTDLNPITWMKKGFISGNNIEKTMDKYLEGCNIEDLKMQYAATSTDIISGKPYNFYEGKVSSAIRASIAVPGIFTPIKKDDMLLVDGGVINNVPCNLAKKFGEDVVIAIDVLGDYGLRTAPSSMPALIFSAFTLLQYEHNKNKKKNSDLEIKMDLNEVNVTSYDKKAIRKIIKLGREHGEKYIEEIKKLVF